MFKVFFIFIAVTFNANSRASNELRELDYAEKIKATHSIGKVLWLKAKNRKFLTLYTETEKKQSLGTAIILHSMGRHPDEGKLVNPLRTYLPQHNWATLSLQMPILNFGAKQEEYYSLFGDANARIQAGIDFLVDAGVENIVLIGDGLGGMMAAYYLNQKTNNFEIIAIVAVSLSLPDSEKEQAQVFDFISEIKQPFLDIYLEQDAQKVISSARKKRMAGKNNLDYRQFKIEGEGNKRQHDEGMVVKRIYSWISLVFK